MHLSVKQIEPATFTAELERVREMGRAVDRQLAAQSEVEALLGPRSERKLSEPQPSSMPDAPERSRS